MATPAPAREPFHVMPTAADGRPRLVLRVGISGHRNLARADLRELDNVLCQILKTIADTVRTIHADTAAQAVYSTAPPILQFVSPLAEGADRVAAKAALKHGWRLATPMPFFRESYKQDFANSLDEFDALLKNAEGDGAVVEIDGNYSETRRPEAYFEVGRFVLRHCDILIAIWDGNPAAGLGGTGDIVLNAREFGIPVFHIHCDPPHAVSILLEEAREQAIKPEGLTAMIDKEVQKILWPELDAEAQEMARRYFLEESVISLKDDRDYYNDGPFTPSPKPPVPGTKSAFKALLRIAGGPFPAKEHEPVKPPAMPVNSQFLFDHFQRADCLATAYSDIHRSHFVLIYIFGALSLVAGFAAIALHGSRWGAAFLCAEFVLVWWMFLLFLFDRMAEWRDRWLDYRLLAEMLREADMLALVGRGLSYRTIVDHADDLAPRARWVSLAFRAISRAAGVTGGRYDKDHLNRVRDFAVDGRLTDQIRYHDKNAERSRLLNKRLRLISIVFFSLTLIAVSLEIVLPDPHNHSSLGSLLALAAGGLTALAYGIFGIRNQAEFEIVGRRSERMKSRLRRHRKQLRDLGDPGFTSVTLGRELVRASEAMRHDVADWIGIFEMKEAEAG